MAFDNIIAGMCSNKKLNPILTGSFIRGRKLNIFPFFYHSIKFVKYPFILD